MRMCTSRSIRHVKTYVFTMDDIETMIREKYNLPGAVDFIWGTDDSDIVRAEFTTCEIETDVSE